MTSSTRAIACNLSSHDERAQRSAFRRSLTPFLIASTYAAGTSQLTFSKPDVTRQMLENLIASEQSCCTFLEFDLSETATAFQLGVRGPKGSEDIVRNFFSTTETSSPPTCGCSNTPEPTKAKKAKYFVGFLTLCAIGCVVPPVLAGLGLISVATGAYLGKGIEVVLVGSALLGLGFLLIQFVQKKRQGAPS